MSSSGSRRESIRSLDRSLNTATSSASVTVRAVAVNTRGAGAADLEAVSAADERQHESD